ncbi:MAG TPA: hypothetical protein DD490_34075 [Acidobacteria bacterium]|nr:hypothetical protein [Acidobacteriota bacterium]
MKRRSARFLLLWLALGFVAEAGQSIPPPPSGGPLPKAYEERIKSDPDAFTIDTANREIEKMQANRDSAARPSFKVRETPANWHIVQGTRFVPVIPVKFADTGQEDPLDVEQLNTELFGGPLTPKTLTLKDYYQEVSYHRLTVDGHVLPWQTLSQNGEHYEGGDFTDDQGDVYHCHGLCPNAHIADLVKEALGGADPLVDFGQMDNDGPDGIPNSGDDNGVVDFVAFVQPKTGGECGGDQRSIWSHQGLYSSLTGRAYSTQDLRKKGGLILPDTFIKVNAFVITPALACDGQTMIEIGVFAHEFGHALGLPDLYDTDGGSDGVGKWCLMGNGTWGADNKSPSKPLHLSAWAKSRLGWIFPVEVEDKANFQPALITPSWKAPLAYKIPISDSRYYLIENRERGGFDSELMGSGLLVWEISEEAIRAGIDSNTVNADPHDRGVAVIQADGRNDLDQRLVGGGGDDGDVFRGSANNGRFDNDSAPSSVGHAAICDISEAGSKMTANLLLSPTGKCPQLSGPQPAATVETAVTAVPIEIAMPTQPLAASIQEVVADPASFLHQQLRLAGVLVNQNPSLFPEGRIVLQDSGGNTLPVRHWLAVETLQSAPESLPTLTDYLDKPIELIGTLEAISQNEEGESYIFRIESLNPFPEP